MTPSGLCTSIAGTNYNAGAGKNANHTTTTQTVSGTTTTNTYCYDNADRLISGSDPNVADVSYDSRGNIITMGNSWSGKYTSSFYYSFDRNSGYWQNWGNDYDIFTQRDVQNRAVCCYETGLATNSIWYGYTGSGDAPDFTRDANWNIVDKYIELGGKTTVMTQNKTFFRS